jgi:hypothetical protein
VSEVISTAKDTGIKLDVYNGVYSLTAQRENQGKFWPVWAKFKKGKEAYQDKDWPVKVTLGDKETAKGVLRMLFKEIDGGKTTQAEKKPPAQKAPPAQTQQQNTEEDVLF